MSFFLGKLHRKNQSSGITSIISFAVRNHAVIATFFLALDRLASDRVGLYSFDGYQNDLETPNILHAAAVHTFTMLPSWPGTFSSVLFAMSLACRSLGVKLESKNGARASMIRVSKFDVK